MQKIAERKTLLRDVLQNKMFKKSQSKMGESQLRRLRSKIFHEEVASRKSKLSKMLSSFSEKFTYELEEV